MTIEINGSGTITGISAGGLPDGCVTAADIESSLDLTGKTVTLPSGTGGKVLQVVQLVETDDITFGTTLGTALSKAITPSSSSSKILVNWSMLCGRGIDDYGEIILYKNGSQISGALSTANTSPGINATQGIFNRGSITGDQNFIQCMAGSYLDSPSTTSSTTYELKMRCTYGSNVYLNRADQWGGNTGYQVGTISTLTLMEVSG